jgi:hypothetical protein
MLSHHRIAPFVALTIALIASIAPRTASADPQPLAKAEAAIAADQSPASTAVRPNPDEQIATASATSTGPCSEVCSGAGYSSTGLASSIESGAISAHYSRPRPLAPSKTRITSPAEIQQGAEQAGLHPGVFGPTEAAATPSIVVRATAPNDGFDWGDAGIGAGGALALMLIGVGGVLALTNHRNHRVRDQHAS